MEIRCMNCGREFEIKYTSFSCCSCGNGGWIRSMQPHVIHYTQFEVLSDESEKESTKQHIDARKRQNLTRLEDTIKGIDALIMQTYDDFPGYPEYLSEEAKDNIDILRKHLVRAMKKAIAIFKQANEQVLEFDGEEGK